MFCSRIEPFFIVQTYHTLPGRGFVGLVVDFLGGFVYN